MLQEHFAQVKGNMDGRIQNDQRTLYESVPLEVKANMLVAFEEASEESGTGMKQRMVNILSEHAGRVVLTMFDDAREAILNGVRGLKDWLAWEYEKMIEAVLQVATMR